MGEKGALASYHIFCCLTSQGWVAGSPWGLLALGFSRSYQATGGLKELICLRWEWPVLIRD